MCWHSTPRASPSSRARSKLRAGSASASRRGRPAQAASPASPQPLLCPSVLHGIELERLPDIEGLPAFRPPTDEPWVYDASLVLSV